ncbi:MAG TPA: SMI1/KNR4 family protein, partial [Pirellulales bacterium]|nr:SMI1/KNR4 family protein [Pirellulales bacterium]
LRLVDRFTLGPSLTPEQHAENDRRFQQRLFQPQWPELERHFGSPMPASLRDLYSNRDLLARSSFYVVPPGSTSEDKHHFIARFEPADMQALNDVWFPIGDNRFPFASDDCGNYFYVELNPGSKDMPVFFVDHDGGDVSRVAESFADFLKWKSYPQEGHP